jgi:hypothetical protein
MKRRYKLARWSVLRWLTDAMSVPEAIDPLQLGAAAAASGVP